MSDFFGTPWTVFCQAPLSMGFSRQEYWSGLPFSSPGDLSDSGIKPRSPALQADSLPTELSDIKYLFVCFLAIMNMELCFMKLSTAFINLFPLPFNNFSKFFVLQKNRGCLLVSQLKVFVLTEYQVKSSRTY